MIDPSQPAHPALVDIDFVGGGSRADLGSRPVLHRPYGRMRSPLMDRRSDASMPRAEFIPVEMPPIRAFIGPLLWVVVPALPILLRVGWQAAAVAGIVALAVREAHLRADRSTISFGEGFLGYAARDGWPHGVQEDDDVHWNWKTARSAQAGRSAGG
jgi:hypothetical protein